MQGAENIKFVDGTFFLFSNSVFRLLVSRNFGNKVFGNLASSFSKYNGKLPYIFFFSVLSISTLLLTITRWKVALSNTP